MIKMMLSDNGEAVYQSPHRTVTWTPEAPPLECPHNRYKNGACTLCGRARADTEAQLSVADKASLEQVFSDAS